MNPCILIINSIVYTTRISVIIRHVFYVKCVLLHLIAVCIAEFICIQSISTESTPTELPTDDRSPQKKKVK